MPEPTLTRVEQKERTRRAILDAALELSATEAGLSGLSLRQVAKAVGIVPTAFYRHYSSIEELGLELVNESMASLRDVLRDIRGGSPAPAEIIERSVITLAEHVGAHRNHFAFIARERASGPPSVRAAVGHQFQLFERELTTDLARLPVKHWSSEDLQVLANLIVGAMVRTVEDLLGAEGRQDAERRLRERAETQLRMVVVGALNWRSDYVDPESS